MKKFPKGTAVTCMNKDAKTFNYFTGIVVEYRSKATNGSDTIIVKSDRYSDIEKEFTVGTDIIYGTMTDRGRLREQVNAIFYSKDIKVSFVSSTDSIEGSSLMYTVGKVFIIVNVFDNWVTVSVKRKQRNGHPAAAEIYKRDVRNTETAIRYINRLAEKFK